MKRIFIAPWLIAALAATLSCGSSKRHTPAPGASAGGESAPGGAGNGGGVGGASTMAGRAGAIGRGGTLSVSGGASGAGAASVDGSAGASPGTSGGSTSGGAGGSDELGGEAGDTPVPMGGSGAGRASSGGAGGARPGGPMLESCATWTLETARLATSTITLTDGGLLLFRPGDASNTQTLYNSSDVAISQSGLTGDFDVLVEYDHFQPGDAQPFFGPQFEAGVWFHDPSGSIYQASGTVGAADGTLAVIVPDDDTPIHSFDPIPDSLVDASGGIELQRKAGVFTVTVTINGVENSISSSKSYDAGPLVLFIGMGLRGESVGPADASVRITRVTVEGGGGSVLSDTFDCPP